MATVFVVQHSYELEDQEETKLIGAYASCADAEAAVARLREQPGFRDHPQGFHIDSYELGQDHWQEGFVTLVTIMVPLLDEGVEVWRPVHAEVLPGARYRIVTKNDDPEDERWGFTTGQLVQCEERVFDGKRRLVAALLVGDTG